MMLINQETHDALKTIQRLCDKQRFCCDCPLHIECNDAGDVRCIFQEVRPCHLRLEEKKSYWVKAIPAPESEEE